MLFEKAKYQVAFAVQENRMQMIAQANFFKQLGTKIIDKKTKIVWICKIYFDTKSMKIFLIIYTSSMAILYYTIHGIL